MRIGFDVSDLCANRADGTTRYTMELAKRLPEIARQQDWYYFAPCDPVKSLSATMGSSASRRVQWHTSTWPRYWTQSRLPWDLYRFQLDVLFMPIQQIPFVRPKNMKTVAVVHDLAFHIYPEQFTYKDWMLQHVFTAYAARNANKIIAVSQATADDIAKYYGRVENVQVVHHGVNHDVFRLLSDQERGQGWRKLQEKYPKLKKPYLLYVGQIQPRKNLTRLVQAFSHFAKASRDSAQGAPELVIAGGHGWLQKPILEAIRKSPERENIVLLGRVGDELLPALYQNAEVFVLPSLYEGFGMPILEAMGCGCPVVTSNVSSMPEVAGGAAILVDPNSVESIVEGIQKARRQRPELQKKGIDQAQKFTWDKTVQALKHAVF